MKRFGLAILLLLWWVGPTLAQSAQEQEVSIKVNEQVTLAGTLSMPFGAKAGLPAVILLTGSGAQDRDETIAGFKPFKQLADTLVAHGHAVLRYDDRGTAKSTGNFRKAALTDFANDAEAAYKFLASRPEVDAKRIILMGHSEGGMVGPMVALRNPTIHKVVNLAGPATNGLDVLLEQNVIIHEMNKAPKHLIDTMLAKFRLVPPLIYQEPVNIYELREAIRALVRAQMDLLPDSVKKEVPDIDAYISSRTTQSVSFFNSDWMRQFLKFEPSEYISQIKCPMVYLFFEKDQQVLPRQNVKVAEQLLSNRKDGSYVSTVPGANHLMQVAKTGSTDEYMKLPKAISPAVFKAVLAAVKP